MNFYKVSFILCFLLLLVSCSFDGLFLAPYPMEDGASERLFVLKNGDSVRIQFDENRNPSFYRNGAPENFTFELKKVEIASTSGSILHAWQLTPNSEFNGISMVFFHGNAGNLIYQTSGPFAFAKRGYKVLLMDYSGFGNSSGEATRENVLLDGQSTIEYALKSAELKADKYIVYGQSLGGHLVAPAAMDYQDQLDGIVIEGAFSSHHDIAAKRAWIMGRIFVAEKYAAKRAIQKWKKPVLIVHSVNDQTIPFKHGERLFKKANEPKSFYAIDSCHICGPIYYADSIDYRIKKMLE